MTDPFSFRSLSRRAFIARAAAVTATGTVLAACGSSNDDDPGSGTSASVATSEAPSTSAGGSSQAAPATSAAAPATTAAAGTPQRGGTMTFAATGGMPGFDPARWWNGFVWDGVVAIADTLLLAGDDGQLVPRLAELPQVDAEGLTYTFALRPDVKFHHGRVMTADDVKFSLDRLLRPATASEGISMYNVLPIAGIQDVLDEKADAVSGIEVVDDLTLRITLDRPDSVLPFVLTLPFCAVVPRDVVEEMGNEKFNLAPVGTGPYVMKDVDLDKGLVLERFADYWDSERPYIDRIEWSIGVEPELAALRIQDDQLDMMQSRLPSGVVQEVRDDPQFADRFVIGAVNDSKYFTLNVRHEALKDVRVRKAIAMALNRDRLVRSLKGLPQPASGGIFSPQSPYYQEGLALPYDPEGAKALLAEAGFADGFELLILAQTETPFAEMAQTAQADLKEIGINAETSIGSAEQFIAAAYTEQPAPMIAYLWDLPYPHGSYIIDGAFSKAAIESNCCNLSSYADDSFEALIRKGHETSDPDELVQAYKEMDKKLVQDDAVAVPVFYDVRTELMSSRVRGFTVPKTLSVVHFFNDYWLEEA